jgi:hypothetical protein
VALRPATAAPWSLFAKNSDRPPGERQVFEWSPPRVDRTTTRTTYLDVVAAQGETLGCLVSRPTWMWGAEHGVNEASVAVGNTTVYTRLDPRSATTGLTGMDLVRLALERATTAGDAVDVITSMIERYGQGGSGHMVGYDGRARPYWSAFLVADCVTAFVVDSSGNDWAVEQVQDARAISNRTSVADFDAQHRHPRQQVAAFVEPRLRASEIVLADRPVTVEAVQQHLRSHDSCGQRGWSVCMHVPEVQVTASSMVVVMRPSQAAEVWALTGSPCSAEYARFTLDQAATLDLSSV